ncbi:MAG: hypothetical protein JSU03_06050 [Bacteroidetes bacterium]|nr:hypothetical protein [Bacteroidota bacterium]MBS1756823.1 hypothetical protein [Bacteroidota bacterium]
MPSYLQNFNESSNTLYYDIRYFLPDEQAPKMFGAVGFIKGVPCTFVCKRYTLIVYEDEGVLYNVNAPLDICFDTSFSASENCPVEGTDNCICPCFNVKYIGDGNNGLNLFYKKRF